MTPYDRASKTSTILGALLLLALIALAWENLPAEPSVEVVELPPIEVTGVTRVCVSGVCGYTDLGPVVGLPLTDSMPDVLPGRGR